MTRSPSESDSEMERVFQTLAAVETHCREGLAQSSQALRTAQRATNLAQESTEGVLSIRGSFVGGQAPK